MIAPADTLSNDSALVAHSQAVVSKDTVQYLGLPVDSFPQSKVIVSDSLPQLNVCFFVSKDTIKLTRFHSMREFAPGFEGRPLLKDTCNSDMMVSLVLFCALMTFFVLSHTHKYLYQRIHDFFFLHKPSRKFEFKTITDARIVSLLIFQTTLFLSICFFSYYVHIIPSFASGTPPPYILLSIYFAACLVYFFIKWLLYSFLGWVFLERKITDMAIESYSSLVCFLGIILSPVILLIVFSHLSPTALITISICLIIFVKVLIFYKWIKLFSQKFFHLLLLFLYFCALEIIPCFLFIQCIIQMNNILIKNF
jgi:hypothetical protein